MTPRFLIFAFSLTLLILYFGTIMAAGADDVSSNSSFPLYVSTHGNDEWPGRAPSPGEGDGPFATIDRAIEKIQEIKDSRGLPAGGITVFVRGGTYFLDASIVLAEDDSGTENSRIVYSAYGNEEVRINGGAELLPTVFEKVKDPDVLDRLDKSAREHVLVVDLAGIGIDDYGMLTPRGFQSPDFPAALEVFFMDRPMELARWPNNSWRRIAAARDDSPDRFFFSSSRPARWKSTDDLWVHGYWRHDWADSYAKVRILDTDKQEIVTHEPHGAYGYASGGRFRFVNVLEELDRPTEWYLDRESGTLYFWPPAPSDKGRTFVSMIEAPLLIIDGASNVTFRGLIFEAGRGNGIEINGGSGNTISGCTVRNVGMSGIIVSGGKEHCIIGCEIYGTGNDGLRLTGGNRKTLEPAGHLAVNNRIHHFSRWERTYTPGIRIRGDGIRAAHNSIHDGPHGAVLLGGNDHSIEFNEIYRVCWETNDVGALYIGRDWTERGNVVRYNFFHHIESYIGSGTNIGGLGANSVYLDDMASGTLVYGNVFYKASRAVFIGGGRDNIIENNIFVDCDPAVLVDSRGLNWARAASSEGGVMMNRLHAVDFMNPPYSTRYPELTGILDGDPGMPEGNMINRNIVYNSDFIELIDVDRNILEIEDNLTDKDPQFLDPEDGDFRLKETSPAFELGFNPIPFEEIGPVSDESINGRTGENE